MIGKDFTFQVDGKTIGFRFGMASYSIAEKAYGKNISTILGNIDSNKEGEFTTSLLTYFWGAAVNYCRVNKQEEPTLETVGDYIDAIGLNEAIVLYKESLGVPKNPNGIAPMTGQTSEEASQ